MSLQETIGGEFERVTSTSADSDVRAALAELETRGRLTPESVVEAARDASSPLHEHFNWNNESAAHSHRIEQARRLIRSIRVVIVEDAVRIVAPKYVRDVTAEPTDQGYRSLPAIARDPETQRPTLEYYFRQARSNLARAVNIAEALGFGDDCKNVMASIDKLLRRIEA